MKGCYSGMSDSEFGKILACASSGKRVKGSCAKDWRGKSLERGLGSRSHLELEPKQKANTYSSHPLTRIPPPQLTSPIWCHFFVPGIFLIRRGGGLLLGEVATWPTLGGRLLFCADGKSTYRENLEQGVMT